MSEFIRSGIFILSLSLFSFWFATKSNRDYIKPQVLKIWIKIWLSIVAIFFLSHNIWLAYFFTFLILHSKKNSNLENHVYLYLLLLCALPFLPKIIPGILGIPYIIRLDYPLFMSFVLLLPLFLNKKQAQKKPFTELVLIGYILLVVLLNFRDNTITNALRGSLIDVVRIIVPYYALTKSLKTITHLKYAFAAIFYGLFPMAFIGIFEAVKHWHMYDSLSHLMTNLSARANRYDVRAGLLRSTATAAGPIIYGYSMVIGLGITLFFKNHMNSKYFKLIFILFFAALMGSVARGMWVGFVVLLVAFIFTGPAMLKNIAKLFLAAIASFTLLSFTKFGQKIIDILPFIGNTRSDTIDYRERLLDAAWGVFQKNPLLGSPNYRDDPLLEVMRQGQGIIDIVNSYIDIALSYGIVGLTLFVLIFISLQLRTYKAIKSLPKEQTELIQMGRALFSIISAIMVMIFTVSSIDYIPIFYWSFVGLTAAYLRVVEETKKSVRQQMLS